MKKRFNLNVLLGLTLVTVVIIGVLVWPAPKEAKAAENFNLFIDWNDFDPQDDEINAVLIEFKDSGGVTLLADELFWASEVDGVSKYTNIFIVPTYAVSVWWTIDAEIPFDEQEDEVPLPQNTFFSTYNP